MVAQQPLAATVCVEEASHLSISLLAPLAAACIAPPQTDLWQERPGANLACEIAMQRSSSTLGVTASKGIHGSLGGEFDFLGDVSFCLGNHRLDVQTARFDQRENRFEFSGNVAYSGDAVRVRAAAALVDLNDEKFSFGTAEYALSDSLVRGSAASILLDGQQGLVQLEDVIYTSCLPGRSHWELRAGSIEVEQDSGFGRARRISLRLFDVPILYLPSLSFSARGTRKSGFLVPEIGSSSRRGAELDAPWYWNIAPNMDATLTPRYLSRLGFFAAADYRFITRNSSSRLNLGYLPNDKLRQRSRFDANIEMQARLSERWTITAGGRWVSDPYYIEDIGRGFWEQAQTHLRRELAAAYVGGNSNALLRVTGHQVVHPDVERLFRPHARVPEFRLRGRWPGLLPSVDARLRVESGWFEHAQRTSGARLHLEPQLLARHRVGPVGVTSSLAMMMTGYHVSEPFQSRYDTYYRVLPVASVDASSGLWRRFASRNLDVILRPRKMLSFIPTVNQDYLPVFDTIIPDFNYVQLFRPNRYLGFDRVGDSVHLSAGVQGVLQRSSDGKELMRFTLGQRYNFRGRSVSLEGMSSLEDAASDYIAEFAYGLGQDWWVDMRYLWDAEIHAASRSEVAVTYRRNPRRSVRLAYRSRWARTENLDLAFRWAVSDRWTAVGRYNYSFAEEIELERYVGFEYESCCISVALLWRRHVERDAFLGGASVYLQVTLKGLASLGGDARQMIERGMLGYPSR